MSTDEEYQQALQRSLTTQQYDEQLREVLAASVVSTIPNNEKKYDDDHLSEVLAASVQRSLTTQQYEEQLREVLAASVVLTIPNDEKKYDDDEKKDEITDQDLYQRMVDRSQKDNNVLNNFCGPRAVGVEMKRKGIRQNGVSADEWAIDIILKACCRKDLQEDLRYKQLREELMDGQQIGNDFFWLVNAITGYSIIVDSEMIYKTNTLTDDGGVILAGQIVHEIYYWDNTEQSGWSSSRSFANVWQSPRILYIKREIMTEEVAGCVIQEPGHWEAASCGECNGFKCDC